MYDIHTHKISLKSILYESKMYKQAVDALCNEIQKYETA